MIGAVFVCLERGAELGDGVGIRRHLDEGTLVFVFSFIWPLRAYVRNRHPEFFDDFDQTRTGAVQQNTVLFTYRHIRVCFLGRGRGCVK